MNILFFARTHRNRDAYSFELISPVAMFDGEGARDEALNAKLVQLFRQREPGLLKVDCEARARGSG